MLEQIMRQYDLTLTVDSTGFGFIAFLRLYKNGDNSLIRSASGDSISNTILKLECNLADMDIAEAVRVAEVALTE